MHETLKEKHNDVVMRADLSSYCTIKESLSFIFYIHTVSDREKILYLHPPARRK